MPFYLKDRDISADLTGIRSALIVPCRFCPAVTLAVRERKPYLQPFRRLLRTASYESYVRGLRARLGSQGIRTELFDSQLPHQFVACMWTTERRKHLARRAGGYDAVIVLGCDAAVETILSYLPPHCRVIPGMQVEGIMTVAPKIRFPLTVSLEISKLTRISFRGGLV